MFVKLDEKTFVHACDISGVQESYDYGGHQEHITSVVVLVSGQSILVHAPAQAIIMAIEDVMEKEDHKHGNE